MNRKSNKNNTGVKSLSGWTQLYVARVCDDDDDDGDGHDDVDDDWLIAGSLQMQTQSV